MCSEQESEDQNGGSTMIPGLRRISFRIIGAGLASFLIAVTPPAQQHALTANDYARAEKFMNYNTARLALRAGVRPTWIADERFWYRVATENGNEFILVDPSRGTRGPAFDQAKLAAKLSAASGANYAAFNLPFQPIDFSADGKSISFFVVGKRWTCDAQGNQCAPAPDGAGNRAEGQRGGQRGGGGFGANAMATSPDGKRIAFVRDYNLWIRDAATGRENQLTTDGVKDFGYADNHE